MTSIITYPENKIIELESNIDNIIDDLDFLRNVRETINVWVKKGVKLEEAVSPIEIQINDWDTKIKVLLQKFTDIVTKLSVVDDRIKDESKDVVVKEDWSFQIQHFKKILMNLNNDIKILDDIKFVISKYNKLGVKLGNSVSLIDEQKKSILDAVTESKQNLSTIVEEIKKLSNKVVTEEEIKRKVDSKDIFATYSTMSMSANSIRVTFNQQRDRYDWDRMDGGLDLVNRVNRARLDKFCPFYDEIVHRGGKTFSPDNEKVFNYCYYSVNKSGPYIKTELHDPYGSQYEDRHNGHFAITFHLKDHHIIEFVPAFKEYLLKEKDVTYKSAETPIPLYVVFSVEKIDNFEQVKFL
jgi:hypothetical protein